MKKLLVLSLCLALISGTYSIAKEDQKPYISANATVTKEINPNYAEISISVETKSKEAEKASIENAEISQKVVNNIKSLIDNKKGDSIETINFNLSPQYIYKDGKSSVNGYVVSNTVKVKIRDVKSVSAIIDEALKSGANRISNLYFGYDEEGLLCNELYAKATKNAFSQAQSVAKALNTEVTGAKSINTSCYVEGQNNGYVRLYKSSNMATNDAMGESTPIETKTLKVKATIDGSFFIK